MARLPVYCSKKTTDDYYKELHIHLPAKTKSVNGAPALACNALDANYIANLVQNDDRFCVLLGVRNSPSHWEAEKMKVLGMIRQFGVPSLCDSVCCGDPVD